MLCQVHTHPQLSYVVIVGVGVIYYCPCLHWFSPAAAEHFSVHSSRHISVRSFHTFQRVMFGTHPVAPRTILVLSYSNYCFSSSSVRCGRCVVRVLSLVVARIFIKCHYFILLVHHLEVFAARLLMRQWLSVPRVTNPSRPNSSLTMRD